MRTSDTDRDERGWAPLTLICSVCASAHATAFGQYNGVPIAIDLGDRLVGNRLDDGMGAVDCDAFATARPVHGGVGARNGRQVSQAVVQLSSSMTNRATTSSATSTSISRAIYDPRRSRITSGSVCGRSTACFESGSGCRRAGSWSNAVSSGRASDSKRPASRSPASPGAAAT